MRILFKFAAILMVAFSMSFADASAQGFLKKLGKGLGKVTKVIASSETQTEATDTASVDVEEYFKSIPNYSVQKYVVKDADGNVVKNEDGTLQTRYFLVDRDGNVCAKNTAKKHLCAAWSAGLKVFGIITGTTAAGAGLGKELIGGPLGTVVGSGVGLLVGMTSTKELRKEFTEQRHMMLECKRLLKAYEQTFTEEGEPRDATVDLSNVDGFNFTESAEMDKNSEEIKQELMASVTEGESMEDADLDSINPDDINTDLLKGKA